MKNRCFAVASFQLFVVPGVFLVLGGCGHSRSTPQREVRFVMDRELVAGCVPLGRVTGSSAYGGISGQQLGKVRAEAEVREKARRLGADVVLVESSHGGFWGADSVGDAYNCAGRAAAPYAPAPAGYPSAAPLTSGAPALAAPGAGGEQAPAAPGRAAAGCEKDTDCKGDRICELGKCVKP